MVGGKVSTLTEAAVDATLDVTADLARVTAERDELAAETSDLSRLIARQADLLTAAVNALKGEPPELVLWGHHDVGELAAAMTARAEKAEKANAEWHVLAERARKHLAETNHCEDCSRTDECDDADPSECGEHGLDGCPACDCGVSAWQATAAELYRALTTVRVDEGDWVRRAELEATQKANAALRAALAAVVTYPGVSELFADRGSLGSVMAQVDAALADPGLGADFVPRAELEAAQGHQAELRRVAEAVREHCYAVWARDEYARLAHVDIDGIVAIVRGTR